MTTGWTGGQYLIYRVLLALGLFAVLGSQQVTAPRGGILFGFLGLGTIACLALAAGYRDRIAAIVLLVLLTGFALFTATAPDAGTLASIALLGFHAATPRAPFGSWEARGRPDPGGDWKMPDWIPLCAWALLAFGFAMNDFARVSGSGSGFWANATNASSMASIGLLFDAAFLLALFSTRLRPGAWIAMAIWRGAWLSAFGSMSGDGSSVWLLLLLAFDPAWIRSRPAATPSSQSGGPARLFYDGECGLCHGAVRFILSEDTRCPESMQIRFSPIGSDAYAAMIAAAPTLDADDLPDSIVLELEDGAILVKASAALEIANRLGGLWRIVGFIVRLGGLMPIAALDAAYDVVARMRKRIFAQPKDSCPILPPHLRTRFEI